MNLKEREEYKLLKKEEKRFWKKLERKKEQNKK